MCGVSTSCLTVIATRLSYHCMRPMSRLCIQPIAGTRPRRTECVMRVALVGGAGEVGAEIARDLAGVREIETLVVADVDAERAAVLARELAPQHPGVSALGLDIWDRESALDCLAGVDVLMNFTSFTQFDRVLALA